jgi:integrase/recombinase XerD
MEDKMNTHIIDYELFMKRNLNLSINTINIYLKYSKDYLLSGMIIDEYILKTDYTKHQFKIFYYAIKNLNLFLSHIGSELIDINKMKVPKIQNFTPMFLDKNEIKKILNIKICKRKKYNERNYIIIRLFIETGIRVSELINIKYEDLVENKIKINGKGNKSRFVLISNELRNLINNLPKKNNHIFVNK